MMMKYHMCLFFFSSRRRHTRWPRDWSSDVCSSDLVNVIARPGAPDVAELAALGVARVSVGGAFAFAALDALVTAARELLDEGTYGYTRRAAQGSAFARTAFGAG